MAAPAWASPSTRGRDERDRSDRFLPLPFRSLTQTAATRAPVPLPSPGSPARPPENNDLTGIERFPHPELTGESPRAGRRPRSSARSRFCRQEEPQGHRREPSSGGSRCSGPRPKLRNIRARTSIPTRRKCTFRCFFRISPVRVAFTSGRTTLFSHHPEQRGRTKASNVISADHRVPREGEDRLPVLHPEGGRSAGLTSTSRSGT